MKSKQAIGIFDSGYGGLTVFKSIVKKLPQYNYIYLGDNARTPYGDHSFETIYQYTLECVEWLFAQGCPLVILACNTASAKALRSIQQNVLPFKYPNHRVLGVIRPTAEIVGDFTETKRIGVMGTRGTINSESYLMEINKFFPEIKVTQQSCPMWVPLIENDEHMHEGADYFVKKYVDLLLDKDDEIDCIVLACTHYPLLIPKIKAAIPGHINLLGQDDIVADSLALYLGKHPEIEEKISKESHSRFFTSGDPQSFDASASIFFGKEIVSSHASLR
ncbi:MAG: glutamate racemase [Candidatus Pedobacter colombiensis]|uniref:Glutamate racemase n=1 Tax=Candidatus Pedobacter colombiensis TaxID=3121371 RepID=A0AAJ5W8T8_9SPHI|nr:glutamate racemase [Pedobacter sp.]WEK20137.1 MAG: glutamate racemase [Pedobacter sp.]